MCNECIEIKIEIKVMFVNVRFVPIVTVCSARATLGESLAYQVR